jgi:two-component system sensor histidine kinase/response regulator
VRLLVVDDNEAALQATAEMLCQMSFDVDRADSGAAAVAAVSQAHAQGRPYAVVLVDWLMPGMDGIATIRQIRSLQIGASPHFAIATAYGREEVIHLAHSAGIDTVLIKPISASMLFDSLIQVLGSPQDNANRPVLSSVRTLESLASIRGASILLADDNLINQQIAREILMDAGLQVEVADNGRAAIAMLESGNFDLVLMDMQMPVLGGVEATVLIRQQQRFSKLPIVAMTANVMKADRDRCTAAGMNDFVAKPVEPEDLFRALLTWIPARHLVSSKPASLGVSELVDKTFPARIEGIDMDVGLRRVMGKKPRFIALLRNFCDSMANISLQIGGALQAGLPDEAELLAHTVKGLAGQMGAHDLQHLADGLETAIRNRAGSEVIHDQLAVFSGALAKQVQAILQAIPEASASATATVAISPERDAVIRKLVQMLLNDDAKADRLLSDNETMLMQCWPEQFRALRQAVCEYDYELALRLLPSECQSFFQTAT